MTTNLGHIFPGITTRPTHNCEEYFINNLPLVVNMTIVNRVAKKGGGFILSLADKDFVKDLIG